MARLPPAHSAGRLRRLALFFVSVLIDHLQIAVRSYSDDRAGEPELVGAGLSFYRSNTFKHPRLFSNTHPHLKVVFKRMLFKHLDWCSNGCSNGMESQLGGYNTAHRDITHIHDIHAVDIHDISIYRP